MSTDEMSVLDERYVLEEVLGRGGMADVYRGTDLLLGRSVAVKILREPTQDGPERARFHDEARTLAGLNHPNLTTVLDAGFTGARPYLVMELVDGTTLADACGEPMDPVRVAAIGAQLADALVHAHGRGLVHRDLKPANVLLTDAGRVVLSDFGIARLLSETSHHTRTGTTVGSPPYLAPEQVRGEPVTTAADIYSLALVLLEALTGRRAYAGPPAEAALARLASPPDIPEDLPAPWPRLLARMTDSDPGRRPSSAEVGAMLRDGTDHGGRTRSPAPAATRVLTAVPSQPGSSQDRSAAAETFVLATPGQATARIGELWSRLRRLASRAWSTARPRLARVSDADAVPLGALAVIGVLVVTLVTIGVLAAASEDTGDGARPDVPTDIPPRLRDPLADLHRAVHGDQR